MYAGLFWDRSTDSHSRAAKILEQDLGRSGVADQRTRLAIHLKGPEYTRMYLDVLHGITY